MAERHFIAASDDGGYRARGESGQHRLLPLLFFLAAPRAFIGGDERAARLERGADEAYRLGAAS